MFIKIYKKEWGWREKSPFGNYELGLINEYNGESKEALKVIAEKQFKREVEFLKSKDKEQ